MGAVAKPIPLTRTSAAWKARTGLSLPGTVSLLAVVSVLVFVSLPRLRSFAQHENEVDARATVRLLAEQLEVWWQEHGGADGPWGAGGFVGPGASALLPTVADLMRSPEVEHALSDSDFARDGRVLRRHGYVFTVVLLDERPVDAEPASGVVRAAGGPAIPLGVQAWPWRFGHSGRASLLGTADGLVFRHPNTGARWNGLPNEPAGADPAPWSWEGWGQPR